MVAVIDSAGVIQERYSYDAYGTATFLTGTFAIRTSSLFGWETLYAGYRKESQTGLSIVRNRYFGALLAWLQRDSREPSRTRNLYEYADSSPVSAIDPSGLSTFCDAITGVPPAGNPADTDKIACFCFAASIADIVVFFDPLFVEAIDCACNIYATFQTYCSQGAVSGTGYAGATVLDCLSFPSAALFFGITGGLIGLPLGPITGAGGAILGVLFGASGLGATALDVVSSALQNYFSTGGKTCLPTSQIAACKRVGWL